MRSGFVVPIMACIITPSRKGFSNVFLASLRLGVRAYLNSNFAFKRMSFNDEPIRTSNSPGSATHALRSGS